MRRSTLHISGEMLVALILAFFGFIGTVSGVIIHLNVRGVVQGMKTEVAKLEVKIEGAKAEAKTFHGDVQLGLEQLKTKIAERDSERYKQLMSELRDTYADKGLSDQKHGENSKRLDTLSFGQDSLRQEILALRQSMESRLTSIEERLPV